ncbi:2OG-Fe(II) oxygenase [Hydrocarboniphaga sp.]|uniref:2OG-Fe(II) oxygenase n=1 Tax=Hydrocarboniphaga sp. TaxID=2033016 RepID=UPI002ABAA304|nr:2OG-Fe(II) oxygenase [Hydrocarboniphaga sp.]MDZ4078364.1 2OG-Fe(II) oxygenase [Hydrocarboniphaga sp.]
MLRFDKLEAQIDKLSTSFVNAKPFEHVVIDDFCDEEKLISLYNQIPDPVTENINKSRDYMFAKNKFEKSGFRSISPLFEELYDDMMSDRFRAFLHKLTGQPVFVDPAFHGGGIHQGGEGSFLDMHVDFNTHPLHDNWFRNLNILLYLNKDWSPDYKGQLKIRHQGRPDSTTLIEPLFNRCVIMFTRGYTVHGYDAISFPAGQYRRSIAAYAYSELVEEKPEYRTTVWYPEDSGAAKRTIGKYWPKIVKIKNSIFGSSTAKNK